MSRWAPQSQARLASRDAQMVEVQEARSPEPEPGLQWDGRWRGPPGPGQPLSGTADLRL